MALVGAMLLVQQAYAQVEGEVTDVAAVASERRAVRGRSFDTPLRCVELDALANLERDTWRLRLAAPETITETAPLAGQWQGSGDEPGVAEEPATRERDGASVAALVPADLTGDLGLALGRYLVRLRADPKAVTAMATLLRRLGRYRAVMETALARQGLPKDLVFVALMASGLEPDASSLRGGAGPWLLEAEVARRSGLALDFWVDPRRDPERATVAAARELAELQRQAGSWPAAVAAFALGRRGNALPAEAPADPSAALESWTPEARSLVMRSWAAATVAHNPEAFGLTAVAIEPPLSSETVDVAPGTTLATVARAAGAAIETLRALNPELIRDRVPPGSERASVRVPPGASSRFAAELERALQPADRVVPHTLVFGESLDDLAARSGLSPRELRRLNGVREDAELRKGVTVVLPATSRLAGAEAIRPADPVAESILVPVPERTFTLPDRQRLFYKTCEGDTVAELADVFKVSPAEILEWNNLDPRARLQARMVLQIFVHQGFDRNGIALPDEAALRVVALGSDEFHALETARRGKTRLYYTARPGDTLAKIGRRYGLAPPDLARVNRLSWNSELEAGQRVVVYSPTPELPREVAAGRALSPHSRPGSATPPKAATAAAARTGRGGGIGPGHHGASAPKASSVALRGGVRSPAHNGSTRGKAPVRATSSSGKGPAKKAPSRSGSAAGRR